MVFLLWSLSVAWAQDAVTLELVQRAQHGAGLPRVSVIANVDTRQLTVSLRCGELPVSATGAPSAGERLDIDIALTSPRSAHCSGELSVTLEDGSEAVMVDTKATWAALAIAGREESGPALPGSDFQRNSR